MSGINLGFLSWGVLVWFFISWGGGGGGGVRIFYSLGGKLLSWGRLGVVFFWGGGKLPLRWSGPESLLTGRAFISEFNRGVAGGDLDFL